MARLTNADRHILTFPPTETTWVCQAKRKRGEEMIACGNYNAGRSSICSFCRAAKPKRPKLLWPTYVAVCRKAKHEPGERWPVRETPAEPAAKKPTARKRGS